MTTHSSTACCTLPTAIPTNYTPKGTYKPISNTTCYITGPPTAKRAIFLIYDVFGFTPQTLQGADILAAHGKEPYLVVVPDFFDGKPAQAEWFGTEDEEAKAKAAEFIKGISDPTAHLERINRIAGEAREEFGVEKWGAIGYCWGGKMVSLTSGENTPWAVAIETSPARVDPEDAKKITIPLGMLASKDEPADAVKAFCEALRTPKICHTFQQVHGWMSARADLTDPEVKAEYERGYQVALEFFASHL